MLAPNLPRRPWHLGKKISWLPRWLRWQRIHLQFRKLGFDPWVGKTSWRREWQPIPLFLPGEFHRSTSLVGYSSWGHKELDMTEWLSLHFTHWGGQVASGSMPRQSLPNMWEQLPALYGLCPGTHSASSCVGSVLTTGLSFTAEAFLESQVLKLNKQINFATLCIDIL